MTTILYTSSDSIRAAIGVTEREISDSTLTGLNLSDQLELALDSVYPDHTALAQNQSRPADAKLYKVLTLYCQYQGALLVAPSYQMLLVKKISDGDASNERFEDDLENTLNRLAAVRDRYARILQDAANGDSAPATASAPLPVFSAPSYDPVTNEGA